MVRVTQAVMVTATCARKGVTRVAVAELAAWCATQYVLTVERLDLKSNALELELSRLDGSVALEVF
jgi:hypothetical protein